jgi:alkylation response protein AidB-like acyl-CoA dehydrogenase
MSELLTELRAFLDAEVPAFRAKWGNDPLSWEARCVWQRTMAGGKWAAPSWAVDNGGRGLGVTDLLAVEETVASYGMPALPGMLGLKNVGPTIAAWGTAEQKDHLARILTAEEIWCQGFSEPGAGSDLAALTTRARLGRDRWILDGQKVWTSQAHLSDWIFVLARTDPETPPHRGISMFLLPLHQPGIVVRPIRDAVAGEHFCEVFFDGAVTDADLIVGGPGDGWSLAMATLGFERGTAFMAQLRRYGSEFDRLSEIARERGATRDPVIRDRIAHLYTGLQLMRFGGYRTISAVLRDGKPGPEASIGKLQWSRWHQELGILALDILGPDGVVLAAPGTDTAEVQHAFLFSRAHTIYAGSSEVQRNIVGERVLGLPKESR